MMIFNINAEEKISGLVLGVLKSCTLYPILSLLQSIMGYLVIAMKDQVMENGTSGVNSRAAALQGKYLFVEVVVY